MNNGTLPIALVGASKKLMTLLSATLIVVLSGLQASVAAATDVMDVPQQIDYELNSSYGDVTLWAGFTPDPYSVDMVSGGTTSARSVGCSGYVTDAPDFELNWRGDSYFLRIFFEADTVGDDTTLIVNGPDGQWHCSDDAYGYNPGLDFMNPSEGIYDIWVGSYSQGDYHDGKLYITERRSIDPSTVPEIVNTPDPTLLANYGITLSAGFVRDPRNVEMVSGGNIAASTVGCNGFVTAAPNVELRWSGDSSFLRIFFEADYSGDDTTLIVNGPDGQWHCSDDAFGQGYNPGLDFTNPTPGVYDIWVGSYSQGDYHNGHLYITELRDVTPDTVSR